MCLAACRVDRELAWWSMNTSKAVCASGEPFPWAAGILGLLVAACGTIETPFEDRCARAAALCDASCPCTIADPFEHCVRIDGCNDDRDCPSGTFCLPKANAEAQLASEDWSSCVPPDGEPRKKRCHLASASYDRALIDGFAVNEMPLLAVDGTPSFAFSPPANARLVACALFGCRPDVQKNRTDVEDDLVGDVVNFWTCSLSGEAEVSGLTAASTGESEISTYTPSVSAGVGICDAKCEARSGATALAARARQVSEISVGCWAYDDSRLVAATRNLPLTRERIQALPNVDVAVVDCTGGEGDEDHACMLEAEPTTSGTSGADVPRFGTCLGGRCLPRCVTSADCVVPAATEDCRAPTAACLHGARTAPTQDFVGVCEVLCSRPDVAGGGDEGGGKP